MSDENEAVEMVPVSEVRGGDRVKWAGRWCMVDAVRVGRHRAHKGGADRYLTLTVVSSGEGLPEMNYYASEWLTRSNRNKP